MVIISHDKRDIILYLFKLEDKQNTQTDSKNFCDQPQKTLIISRAYRALF